MLAFSTNFNPLYNSIQSLYKKIFEYFSTYACQTLSIYIKITTTYKIFSLFRKDGGIAMKNPLLRIENLQTSFRIQDHYIMQQLMMFR